jgi:hypothetical protein
MKLAFQAGCDGYTPVFRGEALRPEMFDSTVSHENLSKLLQSGLKVDSVYLGEKQTVLVQFTGGEFYIATGFSWGEERRETQELALFCKFLSDAGYGTRQKVFSILSKLPEDMRGGLVRTQFCDDHYASVEKARPLKVLQI